MVDGVHVLMGEARTRAVEDEGRRQRDEEERRSAEQRQRRDGDSSSRGGRRARSRDTVDEPRMVDGEVDSDGADEFGGAGGGGWGGWGTRTAGAGVGGPVP
jgi:hypothetical protein